MAPTAPHITAPSPGPAALDRRGFARLALTAGLAAAGVTLPAPRARAAVPSPADWMAGLPSTTALSRLTIPGTHDSAARHGGTWGRTQDLSLDQQLNAGVRFLDIRCRAVDGVFAIHHGVFFQELFFGDVLNTCRDFLRAHRGETVLMKVQQEHSSLSHDEYRAVFDTYTRRWPGLLWTQNRIPALGEVRGRVVLMENNDGLPGMDWRGPLVDVVDDYDIGTAIQWRNRKWPGVVRHLEAARTTLGPGVLPVTFTSSSGWAVPPARAAGLVRPRLDAHLAGLPRPTRLGVVAMDFVDAAYPGRLFGLNF